MKIKGRHVGPQSSPLVIAEIGINHNGSLQVAKKMVDEIAAAGGEIVKHQTHVVSDEMTPEALKVIPPNDSRSIWEIMEQCSLSFDDEFRLKEYAESLGLIYISTPFSRSAADFLDELDVPAFKIGSGECNNYPLIRHIAAKGKPVIMSTGMQTIKSIEKSVAILRDHDIEFALLECTNLYPSPPEAVSLKGMTDLSIAFEDAVVGFSDHSIGPSMALASVALGASIVERHFTDSRYREGPDIICSMDGAELAFLISRSAEIHRALHNPKERTPQEEEVYRFARGSVVSDKDIAKGAEFNSDNLWLRRPGTGDFGPDDYETLLGRVASRDIPRNTQLKAGDFD